MGIGDSSDGPLLAWLCFRRAAILFLPQPSDVYVRKQARKQKKRKRSGITPTRYTPTPMSSKTVPCPLYGPPHTHAAAGRDRNSQDGSGKGSETGRGNNVVAHRLPREIVVWRVMFKQDKNAEF